MEEAANEPSCETSLQISQWWFCYRLFVTEAPRGCSKLDSSDNL